MKMLILPIGKIKSHAVGALAADYAGRLGHYAPVVIQPCRDEAQALGVLGPHDHLVLLDERGTQRSSEELAAVIAEHRMRGTKRMVFFIGGPEGMSDAMRARANERLALSRMTFPHELAQAILLEQLYRACTILKNEPYHK